MYFEQRAEAMGLTLRVASELEFYVFNDTYEQAGAKRYHDLDTIGKYIQDYHILQTTKEEKLLQPLRRYFDELGFEVENSKGEWGPGQEELNLAHQEPVEMADRHCIFKHGVKEIAALQGLSVTFMAKWNSSLPGSSGHLHQSLWDSTRQKNLIADPKGAHGLSALGRSYLGGLLEGMAELTALYAPTINSYKRYVPGVWAPLSASWGSENRTTAIRLIRSATGGSKGGGRGSRETPRADVRRAAEQSSKPEMSAEFAQSRRVEF